MSGRYTRPTLTGLSIICLVLVWCIFFATFFCQKKKLKITIFKNPPPLTTRSQKKKNHVFPHLGLIEVSRKCGKKLPRLPAPNPVPSNVAGVAPVTMRSMDSASPPRRITFDTMNSMILIKVYINWNSNTSKIIHFIEIVYIDHFYTNLNASQYNITTLSISITSQLHQFSDCTFLGHPTAPCA